MIEGEQIVSKEELTDLLKRCSEETLGAALSFMENKDLDKIEPIVLGIIDRHLEPDQRQVFKDADDSFRLYEDLGLDSLTMLEIVMLVEQTLQVSIDNEELKDLRTLGDVKQYLDAKVRGVEPPSRSKTFRIEEVASIMPHREPFLFLESVTIDGDEARGDYKITGNEYFLEGHFKEQPVFPASIMIEALGQMCVFFLLQGTHSALSRKVKTDSIFFTACDGIKCRRICKPNDVLSMSVKVSRIRHPLACFSGEILVNGQKTAQAAEIKLAFDFYPVIDGGTDIREINTDSHLNGVSNLAKPSASSGNS
ncbi:phosphopantetheine-binding protein [Opitutales bacterium]|nr:phosphopantetheine-binding protein [Opitutales bacterium]